MSDTALAEPQYPRITAAYGSSEPGSTRGMMIVRDHFGHTTKWVDYADMEAWFGTNHPEGASADGGKRTFDLKLVTPAMLGAYFDDEARRNPPKWHQTHEFGHLVDPDRHPFLSYARTLADWKPAVVVQGEDGKLTVLTAEAFEQRGGALGGTVIDPHTDPRFYHGEIRRQPPKS